MPQFAFVFAIITLLLAAPALAQQEPQSPTPAQQQQQRVVDQAIQKLIEAQKREAQRVRDLEAYGKACGDKPGCWSNVHPDESDKSDASSQGEKAARARCAKIEVASLKKTCLDEVASQFGQKSNSDSNAVTYDVSEEKRKADLLALNPNRNMGAIDLCPPPRYLMTAINGCHPAVLATMRASVLSDDPLKETRKADLRATGASDLCPPPYSMTAINGCHPAVMTSLLRGPSVHANGSSAHPSAANPATGRNGMSWSVGGSTLRTDPADKH